jgi:hypothetical protein
LELPGITEKSITWQTYLTKIRVTLKSARLFLPDPHFTAKTQGAVFDGNAKHVEHHPTPDSKAGKL